LIEKVELEVAQADLAGKSFEKGTTIQHPGWGGAVVWLYAFPADRLDVLT
jgi:hypothetical protein